MSREIIERFQDIKEGIENIKDLIGDYNKNIYDHAMIKNPQYRDSVLRNYQNIGEAIRSLSLEFKKQHPEINWKIFVNLRNKIVHEYHKSEKNSERVWNSVQNLEFQKLYIFVRDKIHQNQLEEQSKPVESKLTQQPEKEEKPSPSFKM